jgi:hypothetical protein
VTDDKLMPPQIKPRFGDTCINIPVKENLVSLNYVSRDMKVTSARVSLRYQERIPLVDVRRVPSTLYRGHTSSSVTKAV